MIRKYNYKTKEVQAIQFYVNYSEVEAFTGIEILDNMMGHETLNGKMINGGDFIVKDKGICTIVPKDEFRRDYEPV